MRRVPWVTHRLVIVAVVVTVLGVPLAWNEAWAVQQGKRWGAHLLAVVFVLMTRWPFPTVKRGAGRRWA